LAALGSLAGSPETQGERKQLLPGLEAEVWSPWPRSVHAGWAPIFVRVENDLEAEVVAQVLASSRDWAVEREVRTTLTLEPKSKGALELLVPLGGLYQNNFLVEIRAADRRQLFSPQVGTGSVEPMSRQILLLSGSAPEAGAKERWSESLSTKALDGMPTITRPLPGITITTTSSSGGGYSSANNVEVAHATFEDMPAQHAAYSSLDLVVLDSKDGLPSEVRLEPLLAWVRLGGDLLLIGPDAAGRAAGESPALAAWLEKRFERPTRDGYEYRCGLGRVYVAEGDGNLDDGSVTELGKEILAANATLTPRCNPWRWSAVTTMIPGLERLPYRNFAGLLIVFALVIGPVNFYFVRRRKRPVLLLWTIPAIALGTTVALLVYGIAFQGLDVKSAAHSVTVLDQRTHRSACVEKRRFFAGLAPAGLALAAGTSVHPVPEDLSRGVVRRKRYQIEIADGTVLKGDYLPSRQEVEQVVKVERAERARLDFHGGGAAPRVDNNLGTTLEILVVRDREGTYHEAREAIAPGASGDLVRIPDDSSTLERALAVLQHHPEALSASNLLSDELLPPGCFLAKIATNPFRDDGDVEMTELSGEHLVLGILPLEGEESK
jgi:hypothetical protein